MIKAALFPKNIPWNRDTSSNIQPLYTFQIRQSGHVTRSLLSKKPRNYVIMKLKIAVFAVWQFMSVN